MRALGGARATPGFGDAGRVVPGSGRTALLTGLTAAAMAFLAVFALALSVSSGQLAQRWSATLSQSATLRLSAPPSEIGAQTAAVLEVLRTTPGVTSTRVLDIDEQRALLEPWFGPDMPVDALPIPQLIEIIEDDRGYDPAGLRNRLAAEVPGAVLDDHTRWRKPLVNAASRLKLLGWLSIGLIFATMAAMITLAANAALAANAQVIAVLRLVGARDAYIAQAFVRRFTLRSLTGATVGTALGLILVALLPAAQEAGGFLTGLGFAGWHWLWPLIIPPLAGAVAFAATQTAARNTLKGLS
ncbi:MAG: cell division protein FtsX [Rhodobacteraceae bacterium]|nr:cell division protein FtsX [Paracoccaceae bacterium]